jgi:hypothetical protein
MTSVAEGAVSALADTAHKAAVLRLGVAVTITVDRAQLFI